MKRGLLIIDMQNDYFPGGKMPLPGMEAAAGNARKIADFYRSRGKLVVHVQHLSTRKGSTFFLPGTPGAEIHDLMKPLEGEAVVTKNTPNSFRGTDLLKILNDNLVADLVVCGAMTSMCIDATVRAGYDLGYTWTVAADACAAPDLVHDGGKIPAEMVHGSFLAALGQVYARIMKTEEIIAGEEQDILRGAR